METTLNLVSIIIIVFGILQIILFFKMWRMTNDVNKIKNTVQANGYPSGVSPAKIEFILGNTEKAKEMAMKEFIVDIYKIYVGVCNHVYTDQEYIEKFEKFKNWYIRNYNEALSFIPFDEFSTFEKAKKVFH